jgi:phage baseplate assembly protein gpV
MRKIVSIILTVCLVIGYGTGIWQTRPLLAATEQPQIKEIAGKNTFILDNGSLWWVTGISNKLMLTPGRLASIVAGDFTNYYGITDDGKLMQWASGQLPEVVKGAEGVKQVTSNGTWLKADGSVWSRTDKVKGLDDVLFIDSSQGNIAALRRNGDLLLEKNYKDLKYKKLATLSDVSSIKGIEMQDDRIAVLYDSGKVVIYDNSIFDQSGTLLPATAAEDAVHIAYVNNDPTDYLFVVRKDGTVWTTGDYGKRATLTHQLPGLSGVVKTTAHQNIHKFYAQYSDGSWVLYDDETITPIPVPFAKDLTIKASETQPFVGDKLDMAIQELYSNGAAIKIPVSAASIVIEKPNVLKLQPNGKIEAVGVGQSKVTVTSNNIVKSVIVAVSWNGSLTWSKSVNGMVFLSARSIIQAMGGSLAIADSEYKVKLGNDSLSFRTGNKTIQWNGKSLTLNAAPMVDQSEVYIPASVLTQTLGAKVKWDAEWQTANVFLGDAFMSVDSVQTAAVLKKKLQGNLTKYIGKTYWINHFQDWERFVKVTVTDIDPEPDAYYTVVFQSQKGKRLESYSMKEADVDRLLNGGDTWNLLSYDPYKKYNWSSSIWAKIKTGQVILGMTKEQVQMAWGSAASKSVLASNGRTVETWVYSNFDTVSFVNGKVIFIMN